MCRPALGCAAPPSSAEPVPRHFQLLGIFEIIWLTLGFSVRIIGSRARKLPENRPAWVNAVLKRIAFTAWELRKLPKPRADRFTPWKHHVRPTDAARTERPDQSWRAFAAGGASRRAAFGARMHYG